MRDWIGTNNGSTNYFCNLSRGGGGSLNAPTLKHFTIKRDMQCLNLCGLTLNPKFPIRLIRLEDHSFSFRRVTIALETAVP